MLNPEYFLGAYQLPDGTWRTTQYSDQPPADLNAAQDTKVWERRPLYCCRVPAETPWAEARWTGLPQEPQTPSAAERGGKRGRMASEEPRGGAVPMEELRALMEVRQRDQDVDVDVAGRAATKQPKVVQPAGGDAGAPMAAAAAAQPERDQDAPQQEGEDQQQEQQQLPGPTCEPGDCIVYVSLLGFVAAFGLRVLELRVLETTSRKLAPAPAPSTKLNTPPPQPPANRAHLRSCMARASPSSSMTSSRWWGC